MLVKNELELTYFVEFFSTVHVGAACSSLNFVCKQYFAIDICCHVHVAYTYEKI